MMQRNWGMWPKPRTSFGKCRLALGELFGEEYLHGRRPCQTTGLRVRQHKRASQTTRVRQHRRASQTTPTRESDNRHARIRQQKRANMTTKDNEGNAFTGAKCKQQPKREHGINKACGTAVGTLATCDPIV